MSYTRHNWIDPETINAAKLNNIEDGIEEAAQSGGGGYDLVIEYDALTDTPTIASGDILDCEDKLDNGEIVNAIAIIKGQWSYLPSGKNTTKTARYLPLVLFEPPYALMKFEAGLYYGTPSLLDFHMVYDPANGEIESVSFSTIGLVTT